MKKTLIALTISACVVVSSPAMAWSDGDFSGSVDFGGAINANPITWAWQLSPAMTDIKADFKNMTTDTTEGGVKTSSITGLFDSSVVLLAGKTTGKILSPTPGLSPIINFGGANTVSNSGPTEKTKGVAIDVMHDTLGKIGTFMFDFSPMGLVYGRSSLDKKNVYAGLATPSNDYGNGYYTYKSHYDGIGNDGFKNAIITALGSDAPDLTGFVSASSGVSNVNVFSSTTSPFTNFGGAYAAIIQAKSGRLRIYSDKIPNGGRWNANLPVTVTYN